ncbi:hypothetical protein IR083_24400 [Dysgonomonas sp. GY75]|uniref:hypothetical protein n=1 Tax=Dysgonomonas sp. GY75 TaxID=2780419 RepID=UPI00188329AF|nr:hypothetical protein [Dysgonomonas sp. GY75]MBF0651964.1 hypothetical protein [Dysgonomonas sp. GY75]
MAANFKNIHIGRLIYQRMQECGVSVECASRFLKVQEEEVEIASNQKHRAYDRESIGHILHYQQQNKLNNNQLTGKFRLSRNTISKWQKLLGEKIGVGTNSNT